MRRVRQVARASFLLVPPLAALSCAAPPPTPMEAVRVEAVRLGSSEATSTFRASGDVHARVESNLSFRVNGKVAARLVDTGDHVAAGAVLARLDPEEPRADLAVASAVLASAQASMDRTNLQLTRERFLFASAAIAKASLDDAERDAAVVASALLSAKARVDIARDALSYTELRAAHAGIVTARMLEVGQVAEQGATAFTLADDGPRDAVFLLDEQIANRVEKGTPLSVNLIDAPGIQARGVVREISPTVEKGTASVRIKVAIDDPLPPAMTLGSPVAGSLTLTSTKTFTLPSEAIFSDEAEAPAVWVLDPKTKAVTLRRVVVQMYESKSVVVRDGLADGDMVVTTGASRLRPSQVVAIAEGHAS